MRTRCGLEPPRPEVRQMSRSQVIPFHKGDKPMEVVVLVLPGTSQICVSSIVEPMVVANEIARRTIFSWRLASIEGPYAECMGGVAIKVSQDISAEKRVLSSQNAPFAAIVCGGIDIERHCTPAAVSLFRSYARHGVSIFGVDAGAWVLAKAGLIDGRKCTINGRLIPALGESFTNLFVEKHSFISDGSITTCSGGYAPLKMMLATIEERCGPDLARSVAQFFDPMYTYGLSTYGKSAVGGVSKLDTAIRLMENNLEDCMPVGKVADTVKLSRRQLERLFKTYTGMSPNRYYRHLRLSRARDLLSSTDMTILAVAIACGFVSSSHFSIVFREHFGQGPSTMRIFARSQWANSLVAGSVERGTRQRLSA
ncbi:MAG: GlxA family transcriptional regulator [Mesorhizobium sp.]|nr:MAG: GlxA family transcriptional regulator [Mesorhizobium sp.]RWG97637.1 MAG: GlxA family transcriptional regulator [Mesorhizobium sp.]TIN48689.1 MAG: GlxA family transcriptional regulator [Mesorhizobium sp.]TIR92574.1 MAG: GlxA family transcriptional regulator [Mesorhizobium sp.]TIS04570.1 MAG: GlxA family transcriptional regulator [Mesorhizobium sp.]